MHRDFEGSLVADDCNQRRGLTIDDLSDDDLLAIFEFYVVVAGRYQDLDFRELSEYNTKRKIESWQSLIHVCRRWRGLVFGSPRRLNLRLCCITRTPARETLGFWPGALPLLLQGNVFETSLDNVISVLEQSDQICKINLDCYTHTTVQIEKLLAALSQAPFPELASLYLSIEDLSRSHDDGGGGPLPVVLPDSFLGASAPRLRFLTLVAVPFPGLPKLLLLSATQLANLYLHGIPHSGYISPEAMAACLSTLTSLESLQLEFDSTLASANSLYPSRSHFFFRSKGYTNTWRTWCPSIPLGSTSCRLRSSMILISSFRNSTDSSATRQHSGRVMRRVSSFSREALVRLREFQPEGPDHGIVEVKILCQVPDWQLSSLAQICTFSSHFLPAMESLYIYEHLHSRPNWKDDIENTDWLDLLSPFTGVHSTYLSNFRRVSLALCKSSMGKEQQKYCLRCKMFSWRSSNHRDLSKKVLRSSFLRDSSPTTLSPFLPGIDSP